MSNDGTLNIVTKISGQAELNALFDKFQAGTITINEMSEAIKLNNEVYKNAPDVHNAFGAAVARNSVILKDAKDKAIDPLTSANGRMMKSYFQSGEALRIQTLFANGLSKGFQSLGMSTEKATSISDAFAGSIGLMVGVVGVAIGAIMGMKKAFEMAMVATRMELLQSTMQQIAEKDGVNFAKVMQDITDKIGGSVSHNKILQGITDLQLLGVGWNDMSRMMEFAENRSKLTGKTFDETMQTIERASMGNKKAILALKVPLFDVNDAYDEYAKTIGTTGDMLSEVGQKHAIFEKILKTGEEQHLSIGEAAKQELEKYEELETATTNFSENMGRLARNMSPVVDALAKVVSGFNNLFEAMSKKDWYKASEIIIKALGKISPTANIVAISLSAINKESKYVHERTGVGESIPIPDLIYDDTNADIDQEKVAAARKKRLEEDAKIRENILKMSKEMTAEEDDGFKKGFAYLKLRQDAYPEEISHYIAKLQLLKESTKDETLQLEIEKEIRKTLGDEKKAVAELAKEKKKADDDAYKASKAGRWDKLKSDLKESFDDTKVRIDAVNSAIGNLASGWTQAISGLISGTQNIGQAFMAMKDAVVQALIEIIAKMIAMKILQAALGIFGLASGGDVTSDGGSLSGVGAPSVGMAAGGGDFAYGDLQNVLVGEKGMELMQVGRNGVRIISNNNLQKMNQMSQSSRGSGNGNAAMAKAFQSLADKITPASASELHYAMIKQSKLRSGRIS